VRGLRGALKLRWVGLDVHDIVDLAKHDMHGDTSACKVECSDGFGRAIFVSVHRLHREERDLVLRKTG
jgi:hypothetical protein